MVSTRSSITPSEASTSRSANGGTADNLSSTPSGAGGIVDAAARGSSEPAYSPTGLLSLSNELLARIWDIAHTNPYQDWPFSAILVNRQIYRAVLPVWWQRFYLEEAATFDRQAAALSRHPHQRRLLLRPKTLVLDADGDPTSHPFDEYLLDISCIPTLQELTVTVQTEAPITRPPPSFPALRKLRIFNSQLATWILEGSNPALDALELIVHEDQPYHAYPGRLFDTYTSSCGIRALSRPARSWVAWNAPMTIQWDTDAARWTQLARLLPLFPYLRRLELDDFDFCYLAATPAHQVASRLRPQHLAVQYPTLVAILLYLKHTQVLQLRLSCGYANTQLWATRSSTRVDFSFERWTVETAEQNLDEYWFAT